MRRRWQGGTVPSAKESRGSNLKGCPTEKVSREARRHEDNTRIEDGSPDLHRQMDTQDFVFAEGAALSTRAVASAPRECLPANAYQDASQSRIHGVNRPACDQIEAHRCRVFADPTGQDTHRSVERNVPLVEATRQAGECGSTHQGSLDRDAKANSVSSVEASRSK
jgi:hypothetical protein